jgi:hypothetical protein
VKDEIEYIIACSCGRGVLLSLTEREQRNRNLNKSTQIFCSLFRVSHEEHGAVSGWFSDDTAIEPGVRAAVADEREAD